MHINVLHKEYTQPPPLTVIEARKHIALHYIASLFRYLVAHTGDACHPCLFIFVVGTACIRAFYENHVRLNVYHCAFCAVSTLTTHCTHHTVQCAYVTGSEYPFACMCICIMYNIWLNVRQSVWS